MRELLHGRIPANDDAAAVIIACQGDAHLFCSVWLRGFGQIGLACCRSPGLRAGNFVLTRSQLCCSGCLQSLHLYSRGIPVTEMCSFGIQAASLVAAVEIYASMEEAGRLVLQSTGQATTELVAHTCVPCSIAALCSQEMVVFMVHAFCMQPF